jgi:hypothetical protein
MKVLEDSLAVVVHQAEAEQTLCLVVVAERTLFLVGVVEQHCGCAIAHTSDFVGKDSGSSFL